MTPKEYVKVVQELNLELEINEKSAYHTHEAYLNQISICGYRKYANIGKDWKPCSGIIYSAKPFTNKEHNRYGVPYYSTFIGKCSDNADEFKQLLIEELENRRQLNTKAKIKIIDKMLGGENDEE